MKNVEGHAILMVPLRSFNVVAAVALLMTVFPIVVCAERSVPLQNPLPSATADPGRRDRTGERSVALTFDDLPFAQASDESAGPATARRSSDRIRDVLRRHGIPATGFVNEAKVRVLGKAGVAILGAWNQGRLQLGNHGFSHADSNDMTLDQIAQEITTGETTIVPLARGAGRTIRYFRFPYNHVGNTEERRVAIEGVLANRGYALAASTIDTSDYIFDQAHERAIAADDAALRKRIETAYLDYTRIQIAYYARLDRAVLGYEPPEIMLLHLNRLNAAVIGSIVAIFAGSGYRFVTLDEAQSDPAYRRSPVYATKYGPMWGYRWARERGVKVDGRQEKDPPEWVMAYAAGK